MPTDTPTDKLPLLPRRRKFLIPVVMLLAVTVVGSVAGVLIGFGSVKRSGAFKATMAELERSDAVRRHVGLPFEPGFIVIGQHKEREGYYDLTFTITGPVGKAAVRARCERDRDNDPWEVTYLDLGVGGREGQVITLVGDPDDVPGNRE